MSLDLEFVRSQFPAFREPSLAGFAHFENAGGSYAAGQTIELARPVLPPDQGAAVLRLCRLRQGRRTDGRCEGAPRGLAQCRHGRDPSSGHRPRRTPSCSRRRCAVTSSPATRSSSRTRTTRRTSAPTAGWRTTDLPSANGRSIPRRRSSSAATSRRCSARARSSSPSRIARTSSAASTRCANSRTSPTAPAPGPSWTASPSRRTACRTSQALGVDAYYFSLYKVYGPHLGAMFLRREVNAALPNQGHFFNDGKPGARFTPAGPDHAPDRGRQRRPRLPGRHRRPPRPAGQGARRSRAAAVRELFRGARDRTAPATARFPRAATRRCD